MYNFIYLQASSKQYLCSYQLEITRITHTGVGPTYWGIQLCVHTLECTKYVRGLKLTKGKLLRFLVPAQVPSYYYKLV